MSAEYFTEAAVSFIACVTVFTIFLNFLLLAAEELKKCTAFALGCPAMGAEELEDTIVEPFVSEVEKFAAGKRIALFGSYDWGDGEWMRIWADRMKDAGASIVGEEGLICNNEPDDAARAECEKLGKQLLSV